MLLTTKNGEPVQCGQRVLNNREPLAVLIAATAAVTTELCSSCRGCQVGTPLA
jgi:hypothetical protein